MSELRVGARPRTLRVVLTGEVDCQTAGAVGEAANQAVAEGVTRLELDLAAVTFLDSQGLNALLGAQRLLRHEGVGLQLVGTPARVRRLLELTGMDQVFTVG